MCKVTAVPDCIEQRTTINRLGIVNTDTTIKVDMILTLIFTGINLLLLLIEASKILRGATLDSYNSYWLDKLADQK